MDKTNPIGKGLNRFMSNSNHDFADDLVTPYFRKSVILETSSNFNLLEENINRFLDNKGIYFVEQSEEAIRFARSQSLLQISKCVSDQTGRLSDSGLSHARLSDFKMNTSELFQRRKLSFMKNIQDGN